MRLTTPTSDGSDRAVGGQLTLDGIDSNTAETPLRETTFVVVDLETTGGSAERDRITEIGAVKVRGGEVLGEFATLVDPGREIPPQIVRLTGITEVMVYSAPRIDEVLPAFLEFAEGSVLVAHNARFDIGFLRAAAARTGRRWPRPRVLCTVRLARRVLTREEAPTVRLSALARLFAVSTMPTHRALDDARATVEVLHGLLERIGNAGVQTIGELTDFLPGVTRAQRSKRHIADHLPDRPGVYLFRGPGGEVLYVGVATDLRRRARQYFTGAETRTRMREMVTLATAIDHVECAHRLEAGVRELRLLAAHVPAYNRRSTTPLRGWWVALTDEPFPRLVVSRTPSSVAAVGPIRSRVDAAAVAEVIARSCAVRTCTRRIPPGGVHACRPDPGGGVAVGGCRGASEEPTDAVRYQPTAHRARDVLTGDLDAPLIAMLDRLGRLAAAEMFETAARVRDRLALTVSALERCQRLTALCRIAELVAAAPDGAGGWDIAVVRHGRLAAAGVARAGVPPMPVVDGLVSSAQTVPAGPGPLRGAPHEEAGLVYRWLIDSGARIVCSTESFVMPIASAAGWGQWRGVASAAQADERRSRRARNTTSARTAPVPDVRRLQLTG